MQNNNLINSWLDYIKAFQTIIPSINVRSLSVNPLCNYMTQLKEIYNLPYYIIPFHTTNQNEFLQTRMNPVRLEFCIHNEYDNFMVQFTDEISWIFPYTHFEKDRNPIELISKLIQDDFGLSIDSFFPVTIIEYRISHELELINQLSILFMVKIRWKKNQKNITHFTKNINQKNNLYRWISRNEFLKKDYFGNHDINQNIINIIDRSPNLPILEIDSHTQSGLRYQLHRKTVAKVLYPLCSAKIRQKIIKIIQSKFKPSENIRILDAACGDDRLFLEILRYFPKAEFICNDISFIDIKNLVVSNYTKNVIFTNHDLRNLPFKEENNKPIFDVIILKNTLHHLDRNQTPLIIRNLQRIGKMIIIVEIEDPLHSNILARIWNFYYTYILKDAGRTFVDEEKFEFIINKSLLSDKIARFDLLNTIKGRYLFGIITNSV